MAKMRWRVRVRSWFDATMDRGVPALVGWLALMSLALIAIVSALAWLLARNDVPGPDRSLKIAWMSLLRTLDPGTMGGDQEGPIFLALMLVVTIGGIFIVSALIGVLTTGLDNQLAELRKGRSPVIARGHTVLLGWSEQVFTIVSELVAANQDNRRRLVVILANQDKVFMNDEIRRRVPVTGRLRVVCRSGSPLKRSDLDLVSLESAASVIVLSPTSVAPDIDVIKALLLLQHRDWQDERPHIVAAMQNSQNMAAARLAAGEGPQLVDADDFTVRLVVQSHRQAGLSTVYSELLQFAGNEIYLRPEPKLAGRTYGEILHAYERACPIGLLQSNGIVALNPPASTPMIESDQVILVAEDETLIRLALDEPTIAAERIVAAGDETEAPDRTLLIGWNSRGPKVIDLLDQLVDPGSAIDIAAPREPADVLTRAWTKLTVGYKQCEPTDRAGLDALDLGSYQHVVVLADDRLAAELADDRTLVTLLHLRDIEIGLGDPFAIVTEMNDDANREVAQVTEADDFIVSNRLISLLLTQLAENRYLQPVLADLFDPSGMEVVLRRASDYVEPGATVSFATVVESAARRAATAIGYRLVSERDASGTHGVVLNPGRDTSITQLAEDSIIVITDR